LSRLTASGAPVAPVTATIIRFRAGEIAMLAGRGTFRESIDI
jgi:hypothetical protein